jgi:hypothetical protein
MEIRRLAAGSHSGDPGSRKGAICGKQSGAGVGLPRALRLSPVNITLPMLHTHSYTKITVF